MTNEKNFDEKFMELGEYYNIDSPGEVKEFLKSNEGIITLLNEAKPYLEETFSDDRYCLEMVYDPECISCNQLVLKIYVPFERYQNGAHQDIERIRYHLDQPEEKYMFLQNFQLWQMLRMFDFSDYYEVGEYLVRINKINAIKNSPPFAIN